VLVLGALPAATAAAAPRATPIEPLTLAAADHDCFYAPPTVRATFWPVQPSAETYTIRGAFNDLRGGQDGDEPPGGHFGIDIEAANQAPVYAVSEGTIAHIHARGEISSHLDIGDYQYWHVDLDPRIVDGTKVQAGQRIGAVHKGMKHVHLSERVKGCGWVDPRRPTSPFRLAQDDEKATIGGLRAFEASPAAFVRFDPLGQHSDQATPLSLQALHGTVDVRTPVGDLPKIGTTQWPQQPLMPAAVRTYLAPRGHPELAVDPPVLGFDGARRLPIARFDDVLAIGTTRVTACFYTAGQPCATRYVLHAAGRGLDTTQVPDGPYLLCVEAVTIANVPNRVCSNVRVANAGA
jgi:Peptidase family M23